MTSEDPVLRLPSDGRAHAIGPLGTCRIGRDPGCDIVLATPATSRVHALIRRDRFGKCILSDSGSRNGTLINGLPITTPTELKDGDEIRIGGEAIHFEQSQSPAELAPAAPQAAATQVALSNNLVTVFVADMRGFTMLAREVEANTLSVLLSELFGTLGQMLNDRRCFYQKYIGDAIMALWVHERPEVDRSTFAAVLDMLPAMEELTAPMQARFGLSRPIGFAIGINSGMASIGNLGSAHAADFTAVGDAVNKAFRLETATRTVGADVLIGQDTIQLMHPPIAVPPAIPRIEVALKGYEKPEVAYSVSRAQLPLLAASLAGAPSSMVA